MNKWKIVSLESNISYIFKHPCQCFPKAVGPVHRLLWLTVWRHNIFSSTFLQTLRISGSNNSIKLASHPPNAGNGKSQSTWVPSDVTHHLMSVNLELCFPLQSARWRKCTYARCQPPREERPSWDNSLWATRTVSPERVACCSCPIYNLKK